MACWHTKIYSRCILVPFRFPLFMMIFTISITGKETNTYFWHGRDSAIIHELNPKVLLYRVFFKILKYVVRKYSYYNDISDAVFWVR